MNLYASDLKMVQMIIEYLDVLDAALESSWPNPIRLGDGIQVYNYEGEIIGTLVDDVGGAWSFVPKEES